MSEKDLFNKLNRLSLDLYNHKAVIPSQSIHEHGFADGLAMRPDQGRYKGYSVDDTFQLTQNLVDVYPRFIQIFLMKRSVVPMTASLVDNLQGSASNDSVYGHTTTQSETPPLTEASELNDVAVDHSSVFLLVSCHTCLIEIYEELFQHMTLCIRDIDMYKEEQLVSPTLVIGKYTPPPDAAAQMQILLIVQLAAQLSCHADTLVACLENPRSKVDSGISHHREGLDGFNLMSLSGAKAVQARANKVFHKLAEFRNSLGGGFFS